jgi:hypothetical protein
MMRLQRELGAVLLRDPDVAGYTSNTGSVGVAGYAQTANTARFNIALKPRDQRATSATALIPGSSGPNSTAMLGPELSCSVPSRSTVLNMKSVAVRLGGPVGQTGVSTWPSTTYSHRSAKP